MEPILVIGAGLAGCEATWQIAKRGGRVILYEMKPLVYSPAHRSPLFAEIVCSNSFKSESLENAHGVLKAEMALLESIVIKTAKRGEGSCRRFPGGGSRGLFKDDHSHPGGARERRDREEGDDDPSPGQPDHRRHRPAHV